MKNNLPQEEKNIELAYLDDLTGIYNRRYLYKYLSEELPKCKKLALFMIDLDGFKEVNDSYGHPEGDALLVAFSEVIRDSVSTEGIVTRYAGDEFAVVMPEKEKPEAVSLAGKIIKNVSSKALRGKDGQKRHTLTISLGLAIYPDDAANVKDLIDKADQALYSSKKTGKNRLSTAEEIIQEAVVLNKSINNLLSPKFIDRINELTKLKDFIGREKNKEKAAIVSGAKGMGKTRILEEALVYAQAQKLPFMKINLVEMDTNRPYGALIDSLSEYLRKPDKFELVLVARDLEKEELAEIANLIPAFRQVLTGPELVFAGGMKERRFNLFKGLVKILEAQAKDKVFLLAIDDFHLVDLASLTLIYYLLKKKETNFLLCATYLNDQAFPFERVFLKTGDRGLFLEIELKPLSQDEANELAASVLEGLEIPPAFAEMFFQVTKGSPLFIEKAIRVLIGKGLIYFKDGRWRLKGIKKEDLPRSFEEAENAQFADLDPEAKEILINAAFVGDNFNVDVLKKITQKNEGQILDIIEAAGKLGLVKPKGIPAAGEFNFTDRKAKEMLYNFIDTVKAKGLHKKIAEALEDFYKNDLNRVAGNVLRHYQEAGSPDKAAEYAKKVSQIEQQVFSSAEISSYLEKIPQEEVLASVEEILEMPLSQESKKILPDAIIALRSAIESAFLYPANNQARINFQEDAFKQLSKILEREKSITLSIVERALLVNGEELERKELRNTLGAAFAEYLFNYRISSITFKPGFTLYEFAFFLESMTKGENYLNKSGGLQKLLKQNNIVSIKVDQVRYEKAHTASARYKQTKDALKEMVLKYPVLQNLVSEGGKAFLSVRSGEELKNIMESFSGMIKDIALGREETGEKADLILESMQAILDPLAKSNPDEWGKLKKEFARAFFALDPGLKATVIKKDLYNINAPGAIVNDIISSSGGQEIVDIVCDNLKINQIPFTDLSDMLKVILSDAGRRQRLIPLIENELLKNGLTRQDIAILLSRELAPEKIELSFLTEANPFINEFIKEDKEDEIDSLAQKMLEEFAQSDLQKRRLILKDFGSILDTLLAKDKYNILMKVNTRLSDALDKELGPENYSLITGLIAETIKGLIYKENYALAKTLIENLKSNQAKGNPEQQKVINNAFSNIVNTRIKGALADVFNKDMEYGQKNIAGVLVELGNFTLEPLIKILEEEDTSKDPFELYVKRRRVAVVLKKIGREAIEKLKDKLQGSGSGGAKNIIEALGYMEDEGIVPSLSGVIKHPDRLVREELVMALKKLWGLDALKLLAEFLKDEDPRVHSRALNVLLELAGKRELPELEKFLSDKNIQEDIRKIIEHIKGG